MILNQDTNTSLNLNDYTSNVFSQTGEDGIINKILEILPEKDKWCVEFGAWDGKNFSNTRNLILNEGYSSVQIEANKDRYIDLCKTYEDNNVICKNCFVGFKDNDNLDVILKDTDIPKNFDLLSVDIDGNDYHVWESIEVYRPKLVCIEYNPTIPNEVEFVQEKDFNISQGSSILSFVKLAERKGYKLICANLLNAFFIDEKYFELFNIKDNSIYTLRQDKSCVTYIFSGYDGTVFLSGADKTPWHLMKFYNKSVQILPSFLRKFPGYYNKLESFLFVCYKNLYKLKKYL